MPPVDHMRPEDSLTGELVILDPAEIRLWREGASFPRMQLGDRVAYARVRVMCAFPLSQADRYLSFIDWNGKEIGMIERLGGLDRASRRIAEEELNRRYFTPVITRINRVRQYFGVVSFEVETDRGPRAFDVQGRRTNIVGIGPRRYMLMDMDGGRYEIRDVNDLDPASYARIEGLI